MNLIEALKKADGKPVARRDRPVQYHIEGLVLRETRDSKSPCSPFTPQFDWLLADDWYVVEPKSKIEEAIEREEIEYARNASGFTYHARRIVNLTLDEAKEALFKEGFTSGRKVEEVIDALKVKE